MRAIPTASGSTGVQLVTGAGTLMGISMRAAGAAKVTLRDGTDNTGAILAYLDVAAAGSNAMTVPGVPFATGLFLDRVALTSETTTYVV